MSSPAAPPPSSQSPELRKIKAYLVTNLSREAGLFQFPPDQRRRAIFQRASQVYAQISERSGQKLSEAAQAQLLREVVDEVSGFGPIQPLLDDPDISEVMVNGPRLVYVERKGKLIKTDVKFDNDEHVLQVIDRIITPLGRRVEAKSPTVDARLPDGSRVNAVVPPVAIDGPSITIRKFARDRLTVEQLIKFGSFTPAIAEFLQACVVARLNIVISGGTGSGKTTLLNVLSGYIPEDERIVTIEDSAELQLAQEHVVRLEARPPDPDGSGAVPIRALVKNALRMRPERIVIGEVRGGEALDMLQAMNTGHDGSLTTLHANTPRDAISRMETMCLMAGMDLPLRVVREQIGSAVDLIVQASRLRDGSRKITYVTELAGMEGETMVMTDIFKYEQTGVSPEGKVIGEMKASGIRPQFMPRLEQAGFKLKAEIFGPVMMLDRRPGVRSR